MLILVHFSALVLRNEPQKEKCFSAEDRYETDHEERNVRRRDQMRVIPDPERDTLVSC